MTEERRRLEDGDDKRVPLAVKDVASTLVPIGPGPTMTATLKGVAGIADQAPGKEPRLFRQTKTS